VNELTRFCFWRSWILVATVLSVQAVGEPAAAEVVHVRIDRCEPFAPGHEFGASGAYERVTGQMRLEVDPLVEANERVVDLRLAPRNEKGRVEFRTDFFLLKPIDPRRGNRRLFYDVNNRGNKLALSAFNNQGGNDPKSAADAGNGFLMRQGYSILWCGWNGDVKPGDGRLQIELPVASDDGQPITGRVHAEICVNTHAESQPFAWGNTDPYPAESLDHRTATLTVRATRDDPPRSVPHDEWAFARFEDGNVVPDARQVWLRDGFQPGWLYELVYTARDPRVTGLGIAAVRDVVSFLRYEGADPEGTANPLAGAVDRAYVFGISQSARFIQHFLYEGFNVDERSRIVFDGALAHVGGGGRGWFNHRFAQTTRHGSQHEDNLAPSDVFPFLSVPQEDPLTNRQGDLFARARATRSMPRIFYTETSTEYWSRAASLLQTDVQGTMDVAPDPAVRMYVIAGAQHGVSGSTDRGIYQNQVNILDHRPVLRALLPALDQWVSRDVEPPANRRPGIADQTLVDFETWRASFPRIPGVNLPGSPYVPRRLDFGPRFESDGLAEVVPPRVGEPYRILVPAVDADGNEVAGIRLPDVAVPLATYTGWNLRDTAAGARGRLARWAGSYLPLPRDARAREQSRDPRLSILERYPTRDAYLARVVDAALELRRERFLLDEDVAAIIETAAARQFWKSDQPDAPVEAPQ
jgi:hypothetical protein